ncbi:hypothetical protein [Ectopseudomonas alcaliphila]|uniref:Uncharacterized protein n=1 Tax=Ectopseudomonas alcaliphila TaxID=101564 RepID=A0ABU4Q1L6_9GAMM|nr:hypothetical protein [Pseudomonas alcaliphila]MDX5993491.1 hypothetical protein [Pseudomonas alcaliphila]
MKIIETHQFYIVVSMSDLVNWHGDGDDDFEANREIQSAIELLGLDADIKHLYKEYFYQTKTGQGDVYAFLNRNESKNLFAIDMYREVTDQLDIVSIFVSASPKLASIVKAKLRNLFDSASCQVAYEEANSLPKFQQLLNNNKPPITIKESGYRQNLIVQQCG